LIGIGLLQVPSRDDTGLFLDNEGSISILTCLKRSTGNSVLCTDPNADGLITRSEVRQNQNAIYVISKKVSDVDAVPPPSPLIVPVPSTHPPESIKAPLAVVASAPDYKAPDAAAHLHGNTTGIRQADSESDNSNTEANPPYDFAPKDNASAAVSAPSSSDTFWQWRSKCVENARISDTWIVPLINDPRSLLLWLRFFDSSSFLDRIDDEHVEKSNLLEFAVTWVVVPSYPIFRMVQKKISAFSTFSLLGCDGNGETNSRSEIKEALELAARDNEECKGIADLIIQEQDLLCRKETPTGNIFPKQSNNSISRKECLTRTNANSAECFIPHTTQYTSPVFQGGEVRIPVSTCRARNYGHPVQCRDGDGDGHIDRAEFERNQFAVTVIGNAVGHKYPSSVNKLAAMMDKNGDGQVSIAEAQVCAADLAPAQTAEQQNATAQAALQLVQDKDGGSMQRFQLDRNTECIAFLKDSIERQRRDFSGLATVFFLFLRFLCEAWSFITLILWFQGIYRTPRFGTIWIMSIAKHMLGTASVALVFYYFLWHIMPSFIISSVSYVFIYFFWPIGSLLLAYSFIMDGLKPATAAVIKAASPRPPAPTIPKSPSVANGKNDSSANHPRRRASGARAMSPIAMH
jgi:hypothetical protein